MTYATRRAELYWKQLEAEFSAMKESLAAKRVQADRARLDYDHRLEIDAREEWINRPPVDGEDSL